MIAKLLPFIFILPPLAYALISLWCVNSYFGRRKACIECLATDLCLCRASDYQESFCITDALLAAAVRGDTENGLFYTGQSITRIPEQSARDLPTVAEIFELFEEVLAAAEAPARMASPAHG